ncbi:MAG: archease [Phycisphaerae bacterium]|nr:archease [Phycisphaerae bacterium]
MADTKPDFEIRDHTADVLLFVRGADLGTLFRNALAGLYAVVGQFAVAGPGESATIELSAGDAEELFHDWLAEALFRLEAHRCVLRNVRFETVSETAVRAQVDAVPFDRQRSEFDREVKAVTYHELAVTRTHDEWTASVVLDI